MKIKRKNWLLASLLVYICAVVIGCAGGAVEGGSEQSYNVQEAAAGGNYSGSDFLEVTVDGENIPEYMIFSGKGHSFITNSDNKYLKELLHLLNHH